MNFGPNSIKVANYINQLTIVTREGLKSVSLTDWAMGEFGKIASEFTSLGDARADERNRAKAGAESALPNEITQPWRSIFVFLAEWFVVEDLINKNARSFMSLYLIAQLFDGKALHEDYRNEDWAVRGFCDRMSKIDGKLVTIESDLDQRGTAGDGVPDFRIRRQDKTFTLEHTSLPSFDGQYRYQHLGRMIDRQSMEAVLFEQFPSDWVKVIIPIQQFKSAKFVKQIDTNKAISELILAVRQTAPSYNAQLWSTHRLPKSQLDVHIAVDKGGGYRGFWIDYSVPIASEDVPENLQRGFTQAFISKKPKLAKAKSNGENTILLIDSQDIAFTNIYILADAFAKALETFEPGLDGVDDIYLMYLFGSKIIAPVKIGARTFPDLAEFNQYLHKILGLKFD